MPVVFPIKNDYKNINLSLCYVIPKYTVMIFSDIIMSGLQDNW